MTVRTKVSSSLKIRDKSGRFSEFDNIGSINASLSKTYIGDLDKLAKLSNQLEISIGFSSNKHPRADLTFAQLATILEKGTADGRIPARPYLQKSGRIITPKLNLSIAKALRTLSLSPKAVTIANIENEFQDVADKAADKTRDIITKYQPKIVVENAASTLRKKGSDKPPWVDNGDLINDLFGRARVKKT